MSLNELFQDDCLNRLKSLPEGIIDLTITSPPYDDLRTYGGDFKWDFENIAKELYRVTKPGGVIVWIVGDATKNGSETGSSFKQALFFKEIGFNIHDTMIWEKPTFTATGALKVRYGQVFEYMFILSKGKPKTFHPIKDRANKSFGRIKDGSVRQRDGSTKPQSSLGKPIAEFGQRFNVWKIPSECSNSKRVHPAQFPESLVRDHIISWSNPSDLILDPFAGSGTTLVVAKELGRKYLGIELNKEYFEIMKKRLK